MKENDGLKQDYPVRQIMFNIPQMAKICGVSTEHIRRLILTGYLSEERGECKNLAIKKGRRNQDYWMITDKGHFKLTDTHAVPEIPDYTKIIAEQIAQYITPLINEIVKGHPIQRTAEAPIPLRNRRPANKTRSAKNV